VLEASQDNPRLLWNPKAHYRPPMDPIHPTHSLTHYFLEIQQIMSIKSAPIFTNIQFPFFKMSAISPANQILLDLIIVITVLKRTNYDPPRYVCSLLQLSINLVS
jgi:hypothetical protein